MSSVQARTLLLAGLLVSASSLPSLAQPAPATVQASLTRIEPGLESAVKWKWRVLPSDTSAWGFPVPVASPVATPTTSAPATTSNIPSASTYEVKKGDAIIKIARKFGLTSLQLKGFNNLTDDVIRVGQVLNIPNHEQALAIGPFPETVKKTPTGKKSADSPAESLKQQLENLPTQVFLDRADFSVGPLDGKISITFEKVRQLYLASHQDISDAAALDQKARAELGNSLTSYVLKAEDFRFIAPPKAERLDAGHAADSSHPAKSKSGKAPMGVPSVNYQDLISSTMLAYRNPWEFVAERFHCDENFLRSLNPQIKTVPTIGTEFRVPNVVPFTIEKALDQPLQPAPNEHSPITASIIDLSLVTISQNGAIIAVMPMSIARPGLRGKGSWTILNAIPRPRLATLQEPNSPPRKAPSLYGSDVPEVAPPKPILEKEEYLPAGPKNPVGIIWINLAKSDSTEPLPYGLTGTSIPDKMQTQESIGGLRLANWNIARAVRLLPVGTPLEWAQATTTPTAAPAVMPAQPASGSGPLFNQP